MSVEVNGRNLFAKEMASTFETEVIECPDCGFEFATIHVLDGTEGTYECPCCNEANLLIEVEELKKEVAYLREANSINNGEVNQSMNEKIEQYKKAVEGFKQEYDYEHGWEVRNGEGNKRSQWHKGALRGFEHIKEIFDKHFKNI